MGGDHVGVGAHRHRIGRRAVAGGERIDRVPVEPEVAIVDAERPVFLDNGTPLPVTFAKNADSDWIGLAEGLQDGENNLSARADNDRSVIATLDNHGGAGPVLAGSWVNA